MGNQPKKIKVMHICSSASWGGMEMIVARLAYLQKKAGIDSTVLSGQGAVLSSECKKLGVEAYPLSSGKFWPASFPTFVRKIKETAPDILHVHYSRDLNLAVPVKYFLGGAVVFTKHIGSYINKKDPWHRFIYRGVDRATAISKLIKDNLAQTTPLAENKLDIVYLGTDTERFKPDAMQRESTRKELGISNKTILIGMMGRISYGKGYEDFIELANRVREDHVEFLFIGGHSRNEDRYGEKIEDEIKIKLGQKAHMTGFREDREKYLQALDIFIFPSYAESFGLALTEAMASGLPCVAYGKDGVLDIIDNGADGLLAEARDTRDLYEKVRMLVNDYDLRVKLGLSGRAKVIGKFSDSQMLLGFERTYRMALGDI